MKIQKIMYTLLLNNKWTKQVLICSISFLLFHSSLFSQKWEGLGLGDIGLAYFNHLSVDSAQDKLILGATGHLSHINGVSSCSLLKWTPENGVEILFPHNPSIMGLASIHDVLFSNDSMIVVGDNGMAVFKNGQWIFNYVNQNYAFVEIIPFNNHYLIATSYGYFHPLKKNPLLLEWDGGTTFTEFENISSHAEPTAGVFTLSKYQNHLYVGGSARKSSGGVMNDMMMFDGNNWVDKDGWITNITNLGGVNDMIVYKGDLYIGGMFYQSNHSQENLIARWDGQNWKNVGGGFGWGFGPGSETIDVMHVHDGYLYVAGQFNRAGGTPANSIARWDGKEWCGCGSIIDGQITAMTTYRDTLYIGGGFNTIDGDSIAKIARFIGSDFADTCGSTTVGIKTMAEERLQIVGYPNPADNTLHLGLPELRNQELEVFIYSSTGQMVFQEKMYLQDAKLVLNISQLPSGMYFGEILSNTNNYVYSFVKQ